MIQELELMGSGTYYIEEAELAAITQCSNLKRLTLSDIKVADGKFLKLVCYPLIQLVIKFITSRR